MGKFNITKVLAVAFGIFAGLSPAVGPAVAPAYADDAKELRVGIAPDYNPICFRQGGKLEGVEVLFAQQLGKDLKRPIKFVEIERGGLIAALRESKIDIIMSGMSITKERSQQVSFADPYMQVGQMALIRASDWPALRDYAKLELPETRIGVQATTTGEIFARGSLPKAQIMTFADAEAGIAALRAKQIDFFLHDAPTIWRVRGREADKNEDLMGRYRPLTDEHLAWAVRQDDSDLLGQANASLERWRDSGFLNLTLETSIPLRKYEVPPKL